MTSELKTFLLAVIAESEPWETIDKLYQEWDAVTDLSPKTNDKDRYQKDDEYEAVYSVIANSKYYGDFYRDWC